MNKSDYKIVHKKPKDYENSTMSCNSSFDSSNLSNSSDSLGLSNLYIGYDQNKSKKFDDFENNPTNPINSVNSNPNIDMDVKYIIENIYKLNNEELIKKGIIDYLNSKNYSEQTNNAILIKLKNLNNDIEQNILNQQNQLESKSNLTNISDVSDISNNIDNSKIVIIDSEEKNKWFIIVTIVLVIIVIITFYIKLRDD